MTKFLDHVDAQPFEPLNGIMRLNRRNDIFDVIVHSRKIDLWLCRGNAHPCALPAPVRCLGRSDQCL